MQLSWSEGPATTVSYTLVRSTDDSFGEPGSREANDTEVYTGSDLNYTDTGLDPDTPYFYQVEAND